ncbi:MAG: cyclic nucleotide-binding domain-containing protein [Anaerolineaceae bacterium]|nr:cyclic nucleotide-binding domain-containing protein [Anaerolineaceae bacterium]MCB9101803.1 cyclic nucleotide-binding domain-containing protein [Anaerolineales bacterium]
MTVHNVTEIAPRTFLANHHYLDVLSTRQLLALRKLWQEQEFEAGATIFEEDEPSDEIYFLMRGQVDILKWDETRTHQYSLQTLSDNQIFGDVSFLTGAPRSATVKAVTPVKCIALSRQTLHQNHPEAAQIEQVLANHIGLINITRLRAGNEEQVHSLEKQIEQLQKRLELGTFLVMTIAVFTIITLVSRYVSTTETAFDPTSLSFLFIFGSALTVPVVYYTWRHRHPAREFGLVLGNWPHDLLEVGVILLILSGLLAVFMAVDAWFFNDTLLGLDFDIRRFHFLAGLIYLVSSFGQELLARGIIQGSMQRLLMDERGVQTITWSSAIFGIMHINYGFIVVTITFLASLLFGYVYWRQKSLLGVSVLHGMVGVIAALIGILPS